MRFIKYTFSRLALLVILFSLLVSVNSKGRDEKVRLVFNIHQERDIYDRSTYGEPPQFAIWIEDPAHQTVKTIFVTHKTGTGDFEGKVECPVSLPVWIGVFREETGRDDFPIPWEPVVDGLSGATPKIEDIQISVDVNLGIDWFYYIEVNVAGDYSRSFPYVSSKKQIDNHGNGQPSIIYKGKINSTIGESSIPEVIGRSDQYYFTTEVNADTKEIDSANKVFSEIIVRCL